MVKLNCQKNCQTRFLSFNKKEENFHFFSAADIKKYAAKHNFTVKMKEHSKKTSNVLFVLKKK